MSTNSRKSQIINVKSPEMTPTKRHPLFQSFRVPKRNTLTNKYSTKKKTAIVLIVVLVVSLILFFIWPRIPSASISKPYTLIKPLHINQTQSSSTLSLLVYVNISIASSNYINYHVSTMNFNGQLSNAADKNQTQTQITGIGSIIDAYIKSQSNTFLILPILFTRTVTGSAYNLLLDPAVQDLVNACGFNGGAKSLLNVNYNIDVKIDVISTFYTPNYDGVSQMECPITKAEWDALLVSLALVL